MSNGARTENGEGGSSRSSRRGRTTKDAPSDLTARWLYAIEDGWQPFTDKDNDSLEQRYTSLVRKGRLADRSKVKTKERSGGSNDAAGEGDEATEDKEKGASNASKKNDSDKTPKQPFSGVDAVRKAFSGIVEEGGKRANQAVSSGAATPLLGGDGDGSEDGKAVVNEQLDPDAPEEERITRVEVMEDKLFDVNLETMRVSALSASASLSREDEARKVSDAEPLLISTYSSFPFFGKVSSSPSFDRTGSIRPAMEGTLRFRTTRPFPKILIGHMKQSSHGRVMGMGSWTKKIKRLAEGRTQANVDCL